MNHQNRGWRQRMQAAADRWIVRARVMPADGVLVAATREDMRQLLRAAYMAGYTDAHNPLPRRD